MRVGALVFYAVKFAGWCAVKPVTRWLLVSAGTLAAVEAALMLTSGTTYTGVYRAARRSKLGWVPVAAAVVVVAHLEGWLPEKLDPLVVAGDVSFRWLR